MQIDLTDGGNSGRKSLAGFGKPDELNGSVGAALGGVFDATAKYRPVFLSAQMQQLGESVLRSKMATALAINKAWNTQKAASALIAEVEHSRSTMHGASQMQGPADMEETRGSIQYSNNEKDNSYQVGASAAHSPQAGNSYSAHFAKQMAGGTVSGGAGYSDNQGPQFGIKYERRF